MNHPTRILLAKIGLDGHDRGVKVLARTFREAVHATTSREALDLYGDVLLKIQTHHVDAPNWRRLAEFGTTSLEIALSDPLFIEANLTKVSQAQIDSFRRQLRSRLNLQGVNSRHTAQDVAATAGAFAASAAPA